MTAKPKPRAGQEHTDQEREEYHDLLLRFREFLAERGKTFQEGMRAAIAAAMGERPTLAKKVARGPKPRK